MKSTTGTRTYESPLREEQAEQTKARILDATARVLAAQDGRLSIPAVAREAGVSIPTVYRHFGTREELLGALGPHFVAKLSNADKVPPANLDELRAFLLQQAADYEETEPALRAALTTEAGQKARRDFMPRRLELIEQGLAPLLEGVSDEDRMRIRNVYLLHASSAGYRASKEYFDYSNEELADQIVWLVETLARGAKTKNRNRKEKR
jgi:AcrR family transcriptional regulator